MLESMKLRLVDRMRRTDALPMYRDFLESQWASQDEIASAQWTLLQSLIEHAFNNVPYYRDVFHEGGIVPADIKTLEDFQRLPILTKELARENRDRLIARNSDQYQPRAKTTGGSTGTPLQYYLSRKAHSASWASAYRAWSLGGWKPGDRVAFMAGTSLIPGGRDTKKSLYIFMNNWKLFSAFDAGSDTYARWADELRRAKTPFVYGYATTIYLFAQYVLDQGIDDLTFRAVFPTSEVLRAGYRESIEEAFSCEVFDTYGGTDGAGFAYECGQHDGLHVVSESSFMEIVNENDNVLPQGAEGRVITTDLYNYAMPFIRWDVNDIAALNSEPCQCGRASPRMVGIRGRQGDHVTTRDGDVVPGNWFDGLFRDKQWVSNYYAQQDNLDELNVFVKPLRQPSQEEINEVQSVLDQKFVTLKARLRLTDAIPQTPGGKYMYIVNNTLR
jgi:phenylacetate-CoA ligase